MEQFCTDLQAERARHGATLAAIAHLTKIPERHLAALETGRFTELPGGIFRKGILRSYLQAISVDPAPWIPRFEALLASLAVPQPSLELPEVTATLAASADRVRAATPPRPAPPVIPSSPPPAFTYRWSGVVAALALLLGFGWCVWHFALRGRVVLSFATPAVPARHFTPVAEQIPDLSRLR